MIDILKNPDIMHNTLQSNFKRNANEEEDAKQLQEFFEYIIYDKDRSNGNNPFLKLLSASIREELQKNTYVQNMKINNTSSELKGKYGEEGFAYLINSAIALLVNSDRCEQELQQVFNQLDKQDITKVVMGDMQASMLSKTVLKQIVQESVKLGQEQAPKAYLSLFGKYGTFALRQGKIDVDMGRLELDTKSNSLAKRLSKITATIKNYNANVVHLETVSILKALQGYYYAVTRVRDVKKINKSYENYLLQHVSDENGLQHIQHIVNIYALTGMGQVYIDRAKHTMVESKLGAKFLMVNQRKAKKVYIIPTSSVSSLAINDKEKDVGFRYGGRGRLTKPQLVEKTKNGLAAKHAFIDVSLNVYKASRALNI